jgi:predicted anti-sigma-YlaC factor YlaD
MSKKTGTQNMANNETLPGGIQNHKEWTCHDVGQLLSRYQDGELDQSRQEQVDLHLQQCSECRSQLNMMVQVTQQVKQLPEMEADMRFTHQVMGKVRQSRIRQNRWFAVPSVVYTFVFMFFLVVGFYATRNIDPLNTGQQFTISLNDAEESSQSENQAEQYLSQLVTETQSLRLMSVHENALNLLDSFNSDSGE